MFYIAIVGNVKQEQRQRSRRSTVKAPNRKFIKFMSFQNITFIFRAFQV